MPELPESTNLPAQIAEAIAAVPKALIPASVKAFDRLIGATVDVPVAWLAQHKAKIDAQTEAYKLVEASIGKAAATQVGVDQATIQRAVDVLVRKAYRTQNNREAVAAAAIEDLRSGHEHSEREDSPQVTPPLDDDWLNVFERYAEDASTERMQNLWGRVLAGEIRKPGRYSMRTLRFLSEFSQADALTFSEFCNNAFSDVALVKLVKPEGTKDIRSLVYLESAGLIQGASGTGLSLTITLNEQGLGTLNEGSVSVILKGEPNATIGDTVYAITPLGQELMSLLPNRNVRAAGRKMAEALRSSMIKEAYLAVAIAEQQAALPIEILWQDAPMPPVPVT